MFEDAVMVLSQVRWEGSFVLEVGGRRYSSEGASLSNFRGSWDYYWIWEDPCAHWLEGDDVGVVFAHVPEGDPRLRNPVSDASLGSLGLEGASLEGSVSAGVGDYLATTDPGVEMVTVAAGAASANACGVHLSPADADPEAEGHQVALDGSGAGAASIEVTAADGVTTGVYTVTFAAPGPLPAMIAGMGLEGVDGPGFDPLERRHEVQAPAELDGIEVSTRQAPGVTTSMLVVRPPGTDRQDDTDQLTGTGQQSLRSAGTDRQDRTGQQVLRPVGAGTQVELRSGSETLIAVWASTQDNERQTIYTTRVSSAPDADQPAAEERPRPFATMYEMSVRGYGGYYVDPWLEFIDGWPERDGHFEVTVPYDVSQVTINAAAYAKEDRVQVFPADAALGFYSDRPNVDDFHVSLNAPVGGKPAQTAILLTASRGNWIRPYTITVTREAAPADSPALSALSLSEGELRPGFGSVFKPLYTSHAVAVDGIADQVTVEATAAHSGATVAISPADADPLVAGHQVDAVAGGLVVVKVTSADRSASRRYVIRFLDSETLEECAPYTAAGTDIVGGLGDTRGRWANHLMNTFSRQEGLDMSDRVRRRPFSWTWMGGIERRHLTVHDMRTLQSLTPTTSDGRLPGIEYAISLQKLDMRRWGTTSVGSAVESFCGMAALQRIDQSNSSLTEFTLDADDMADLASLNYLNLSYQGCRGWYRSCGSLKNIELAESESLEFLYVQETGLNSLHLPSMPQLRKVYAFNSRAPDSRLTSFTHGDLPSLAYLHMVGSGLTEFHVSPQLTGLETLLLTSSQQLRSVAIPALPELKRIDLGGTALTSFTIPEAPKLERIALGGLGLTSLEIPVLPKLRELWLGYNHLTSLTIPDLPELRRLDLEGNRLTSLTFPDLPELRRLDLEGNRLTSLTVPSSPHLSRLELRHNSLSTLTLPTTLNSLEEIDADYNDLTEVTIPDLDSLIEVRLAFNELTSFRVPHSSKLRRLDVSHNSLTSLDLPSLPSLYSLTIENNPISQIDVTNLTGLGFLWVADIPDLEIIGLRERTAVITRPLSYIFR